MNFEYYECKLRDLNTRAFSLIYLMLFLSITTLFEVLLARSQTLSFWGFKIFFLTIAVILSTAFATQIERAYEKKFSGILISFLPCSLIIVIMLMLEKMLVVSTDSAMWPEGTLGAAFFVKPQDIYLPALLIFIFWGLLDFKFSFSRRRAFTPRILFWTFCSWWFAKDIFRLGTFLFELYSVGSWSFTIIIILFSLGALWGMFVSREKESGVFWVVTTANLATNAVILLYLNAYT